MTAPERALLAHELPDAPARALAPVAQIAPELEPEFAPDGDVVPDWAPVPSRDHVASAFPLGPLVPADAATHRQSRVSRRGSWRRAS